MWKLSYRKHINALFGKNKKYKLDDLDTILSKNINTTNIKSVSRLPHEYNFFKSDVKTLLALKLYPSHLFSTIPSHYYYYIIISDISCGVFCITKEKWPHEKWYQYTLIHFIYSLLKITVIYLCTSISIMFRFEYKFLNDISYSNFYSVPHADSNIHYKKGTHSTCWARNICWA